MYRTYNVVKIQGHVHTRVVFDHESNDTGHVTIFQVIYGMIYGLRSKALDIKKKALFQPTSCSQTNLSNEFGCDST